MPPNSLNFLNGINDNLHVTFSSALIAKVKGLCGIRSGEILYPFITLSFTSNETFFTLYPFSNDSSLILTFGALLSFNLLHKSISSK